LQKLKLCKLVILILFSLETVSVTFLCMYFVFLLTTSLDVVVNVISTVFAGIFGFAVGSVVFWRVSTTFSEGGASKRFSL